MSEDIIQAIKQLKQEKNAIVLAHNYVIPIIQQIADYVGDSLGLAKKSAVLENDIIVFAGVTFMAETTSILCPDKKVVIPSLQAKCPMAEQLDLKTIKEAKETYPDIPLAVYVNTTAAAKAEADICFTSGNAVKVLKSLPQKEILVGPDYNLAQYVAKHLPDKKLIPVPKRGGCYTHHQFKKEEIEEKVKKYPNAKLLVHPEAPVEVQELADYICSTQGMLDISGKDDAKEFIIATEIGLINRLRRDYPDRIFYPASLDAICWQMKKNTLHNLYAALKRENPTVKVDTEIATRARMAIDRMLQVS